ncbi:MAG TPA: hypothetical protein VNZ86_20370, partial [Bacteroidia bacterium]|nr:hypothetical protein [Bacteroidia bacterium]
LGGEKTLMVRKHKYSYFVSDRLSEPGKTDVYKVISSAGDPGLILIRGHIDMVENPALKRAKIVVYNASNEEKVGVFNTSGDDRVGIYNTNPLTGNYLLILVPNVNYVFKVEVDGYEPVQQQIEIPLRIDYEVCRQEIKLHKNEQRKSVLVIHNYFSDENEKVFFLKASPDSLTRDADYPSPIPAPNKSTTGTKAYMTIDEMVKKQVEEEKKKPLDALKAFKSNDFETALPLYAYLVRNDQTDPIMNYYYGVCLFHSSQNKAKAIPYLDQASRSPKVPYDVFLYLGKACHLSYMFNDAIAALDNYRKKAKPEEMLKNHVAELLGNCRSGNVLMSEQVNVEVIKRTSMTDDDILSYYNPDLVNEKILYKTDFFTSPVDKKLKAKLLMCKSGKSEVIQVSYGMNEQNGKDLYHNIIASNGIKGQSVSLGAAINTPYDEDYPYITKDGKTLYFSSKGHNSMGGYDIFKCTRPDTLSVWSKPQNMGYPINSPYDDILYIPESEGEGASYCTNRKNGKYEFMQVKIHERSLSYSIIKGRFSTLDSVENRNALLTVFNAENEEIVGVYKTNPESGHYLMVLLAGASYHVEIESEGFPVIKRDFQLPEKKGDFILRQEIGLHKDGAFNLVTVNNFFTEEEAQKASAADEAYQARADARKDKTKKAPEPVHFVRSGKSKRTEEQLAKDEQVMKSAKALYEQQNYKECIDVYQRLEIEIDLDPISSYYLGMSLYFTAKDKTDCLDDLEFASTSKDVPADVFYYLARANQCCYRFSRAIKAFEKYKLHASAPDLANYEIDKEMEYCRNGIKLVNNPVVLEVYEKREVMKESLHLAFAQLESGAKLLLAPDELRSSIDKKKNYRSVLFLSADKSVILYTSYGEDETNGKDIYRLNQLGDGKWSMLPQNLNMINTRQDEEFPTLSADGKTLYFASKGYDSMGGYDIFKSTWDEANGNWSVPVNLGAPINSPYDDIYFIE